MKITTKALGKKFDDVWVFSNLNLLFELGNTYAITGPNGVGKSTLLLTLSNFLLISSGELVWENDDKTIPPQQYKNYFNLISPEVEIPMEWTVNECLAFNAYWEDCPKQDYIQQIVKNAYLQSYQNLQLHQLSSGTRGRLLLAMALHSAKPILFLDEPTTYFDKRFKEWAFEQISKQKKQKLMIISTNDSEEAKLGLHQIRLPM